jgi:hypothetical protein
MFFVGLTPEHMDEHHVGVFMSEYIDDMCVHDVGQIIVLLGEALDVLMEGLVDLCLELRRSQELPCQV